MINDTLKEIEEIPKYKNGSKAIPKDEIVVQYSAVKSSIIKVLEQLVEREEKEKIEITCDLPDIVKMCEKCEEAIIYNKAKQDTIAYLKSEIATLSTNIDKE